MKLIFFGPPGCGKGTYASRVAERLGIVQVATGDLFRAEVAAHSELGKMAESYIKKGALVPDEITIGMLRQRISRDDCRRGFILDGFPRTMEQAHALDEITRIDLVVNFVLDEDILIEKSLARRVCKECGNTYNIADIRRGKLVMPPLLPEKEGICDKCGGHLIQRQDDTLSVIKDRQDVYWQQSAPILKYYGQKKLVRDIEVIGPPDVMVPIVIDAIRKTLGK